MKNTRLEKQKNIKLRLYVKNFFNSSFINSSYLAINFSLIKHNNLKTWIAFKKRVKLISTNPLLNAKQSKIN